MHILQSLFYLTTALHVSGITSTHLQEHKTTVTTASGNRYTIVDRVKFTDKGYIKIRLKLPLLLTKHFCGKCSMFYTTCMYTIQFSSNSSTIAAGSSYDVTNTRCCRWSCMRTWWRVEVPPETCRAVSRYNKLCDVATCWINIGINAFNWYSKNKILVNILH
jgi:hypothetical protein